MMLRLTSTLLLCLLPSLLPAQARVHEDILDLKAEGRAGPALAACSQDLTRILAKDKLSQAAGTQAEYVLTLAELVARKYLLHKEFCDMAEALAKSPGLASQPVLASWLRHYETEHLRAQGKLREAAEILDGLGYVRDFQVIGPLDNERGGGFRDAREFESAPAKLDLSATLDGKKRPVTWKRIQLADEPSAVLELSARQRPNSQVLSYLAFAVNSPKAQVLSLRMASGGSLAAWVGGKEVLRRDCSLRSLGFDQDVCALPLEAGANLVLVKVCTQSGGYAARLRICDLDGSSLGRERIQISAAPEAIEAAKKAAPFTPAETMHPAIGAEAHLEALLANSKDMEDKVVGTLAFQLTTLTLARGADDETSRRDRRWAQVATDKLPDMASAWYLQGFTMRKLGASAADREENARITAYKTAIAKNPRHAEAMVVLAQMDREDRKELQTAEQWADRALAINPEFVLAISEKLACLSDLDLDIQAQGWVRQLLTNAELASHPTLQDQALDLADTADDPAAMIAAQEKILARSYSSSMLRQMSRTLLKAGKRELALATAQQAVQDFPQSRTAYSNLARLYEATGDLTAASQAWNAWLEICPEDELAWLSLSKIAALEGRTEAQVGHLERALELKPTLKEERRKLEFLRSGAKTFYADYRIDAAGVIASDRGPDADAKEKNDAYYVLLDQLVVRAYRNGTTSTYQHQIVRILSEEGINRFDTYRAPYSSYDQTARILTAKVIKKDGKENSARLGRGGYVDLPPIEIGDLVEIEARVDDRSRSFFGDYFGLQHYFGSDDGSPTHRAVLDLVLEPGRQYHFQTVGTIPEPAIAKTDDGAEHRRYEMQDIPRIEYEPNAPSPYESGPLLRVSTYGTWNEFSAWWWNLIRKQTVVTPEIRAKVIELTKDEPRIEDKVRKVYEWVVTDVRYKAWEFGVHGYKPYSVASIFARRHGDCKDKAILTNAMLSVIGVKSYPILIKADGQREKDDLTLPLVQHFNHCISYMPAQQGMPGQFLDGTAEYHPIDTLPDMDRGAHVLLVKEGKGEIVSIPWTDAMANQDRIHYKVFIQANGDALVEMEHSPLLNMAVSVRMRYGNEQGKRRERLSDRLGAIFGKVEILDMEFSDLENLDEKVDYKVKFKVKDFVAREGEAFRVKTAFQPARLSQIAGLQKRLHDLILTTPSSKEVVIEYIAPAGFTWQKSLQDERRETPENAYQLDYKVDGQKLTVTRLRAFKTQRIPAKDYPAFRDWALEVEAAEKRPLILSPKK